MTFRALALAMMSLVSTAALADEGRMREGVMSGRWLSMYYSTKNGLRQDLCAAASKDGLWFRADAQGLQIRMIDRTWSLSGDETGVVTISVGSDILKVQMEAVHSTMLGGVVSAADLTQLLNAMGKAKQATVTFGTKTTEHVSLAGSTRVLNDFRDCVGMNGFADLGMGAGGNSPF